VRFEAFLVRFLVRRFFEAFLDPCIATFGEDWVGVVTRSFNAVSSMRGSGDLPVDIDISPDGGGCGSRAGVLYACEMRGQWSNQERKNRSM
jgi:hypothetical protein